MLPLSKYRQSPPSAVKPKAIAVSSSFPLLHPPIKVGWLLRPARRHKRSTTYTCIHTYSVYIRSITLSRMSTDSRRPLSAAVKEQGQIPTRFRADSMPKNYLAARVADVLEDERFSSHMINLVQLHRMHRPAFLSPADRSTIHVVVRYPAATAYSIRWRSKTWSSFIYCWYSELVMTRVTRQTLQGGYSSKESANCHP